MKWIYCAAALPLSLSAIQTVVEVGVDYRADDFETTFEKKIQNQNSTEIQKINDVSIWEIGGRVAVDLPYCFMVGFEGKYGFICEGDAFSQELFVIPQTQMAFNTIVANDVSGNTYDLIGLLGFRVIDCREYLVLTPEVGYSYYYNSYDFADINISPILEDMTIVGKPSGHLDYRYHGPWIGFQGAYQPFCGIFLYGTLRYNWLQYRAHGNNEFVYEMDDAFFGNHRDITDKGNARGPVVRVGSDVQFFPCFTVGLLFEYRYFNTMHANRDQTLTETITENGQIISSMVTTDSDPLNHVRSKTWYLELHAG